MSDQRLLAAWQQGDRAALDGLVRRHMPAVTRFFQNKALDDGPDLAQETFERCFAAMERFEGRSGFRTFLFSIAKNVLLEYYRSKHRTRFDPMRSSVADLHPSPSGVVAQEQTQARVLAVLRSVPLSYQIILEFYYWEGLGTREIAETLGLPRGTVKSRLFHAREHVRRAFERASVDPDALQLTGWARPFDTGQ